MTFFDRLQGEAPRYGWARDAHDPRWNPSEVARRMCRTADPRRVGIIGAGMAGVHMAWLLKRRGFRDITVLERSGYVGGKVLTLEAGGLKHEMGACYTTPEYRQVRALLSEFGLYDRAPVAGRNVINADNSEEEFGDWAADQFREQLSGLLGKLPSLGVGLFVLRDIWRYNRIHRSIFGRYDGVFPPRPSERGMQELQGTFIEFLERHELQTLIPVMRLFQTAQGYGYIEQVPAYYGLLWNDPGKMKVVIEQLTGRSGKSGVDLTKAGMQSLVEEMVIRAAIRVELYTEVIRIHRGEPIRVRTRDTRTDAVLEHDFDLLFVAAPAGTMLERFVAPTEREQALFGNQTTVQLTTTLQRGRQPVNHGIDSWMYRVNPGHDHEVITQRLSSWFLGPEEEREDPPATSDLRVVYQFGAEPASAETIEAKYLANYTGDTARPVEEHEVLARHIWTYFPHWDEAAVLAGAPWEVLGMQGENGTWWIGSSVCFESLRDIVNYNLLVVSRCFDG